MAYDNYIIKHKDIDIGKITINKNNYNIIDTEIENSVFSPISNSIPKDEQIADINQWFNNRCIPGSRYGIDILKKTYNIHDLRELMVLSLGLSLSDHYWIVREKENKIKWNEINFFDNKYSENMGKVFFDKHFVKNADLNIGYVPDSSLNGLLKKRWHNNGQINILIKNSSEPYKQEPFNEYFSSLVLDKLNINHITYNIIKENEEYNSTCPCIINKDTEMVSFVDMLRKYAQHITREKYDGYTRILDIAQSNSLPAYKEELHNMAVADYILCNNDRHWNNFGILRDSNNGKWISAIPLFDNGGSLWNGENVPKDTHSKCNSFANTNEECIKLLKININKVINKDNLIDLIDIFDTAFNNYSNAERKKILRNGLIQKRKLVYDYMDKCEFTSLIQST